MNPQELANHLGISIQELAQRMIQEAVRLSRVLTPRNAYTRKELGDLGREISRVLFNQQYGGSNEGRTYERFWGGNLGRTKATNRLCAYILHKQGTITYEPWPNEPGDAYWLQYCTLVTGQQIHEAAREDVPNQPVNTTKKYRAYFFSHIRYNVWSEGTIEMNYTTEHRGTVSGKNFYRGMDDAFEGNFEIRDNYICMDLQGRSKLNWFRLIGKIEGQKMKDAPFFRAAYIAASSYARQYISAIEVIFLEETYEAYNPLEVQKIKRYLMLQRHRFQSDILAPSEQLEVIPSKLKPNNLEGIIGNYACVSKIHDQILVSSLVIDEIYRTTFKTKIYQKSGHDKNYQLCYLELLPTGAQNYIHIKGYLATKNTDEPTLEHLFSTLTIPMTVNDTKPIRGTFNSLIELNGKEILWAGDCYLIKLDNVKKIEPFICHIEDLKNNFNNDQKDLYDIVYNVVVRIT